MRSPEEPDAQVIGMGRRTLTVKLWTDPASQHRELQSPVCEFSPVRARLLP
jgi:hypothetical protein